MDNHDLKIVAALQVNGRLPIADLAEKIGLSTTPCWRRVRRLEENGVIAGYTAIIDPAAFGITLDVFIEVSLDLQQAKAFEEAIQAQEEVIECYAVTGGRDYLLHVMVTDIDACDHFLRNQLIHLPGVEHLKTHLALNPIKKVRGTPLPKLG